MFPILKLEFYLQASFTRRDVELPHIGKRFTLHVIYYHICTAEVLLLAGEDFGRKYVRICVIWRKYLRPGTSS